MPEPELPFRLTVTGVGPSGSQVAVEGVCDATTASALRECLDGLVAGGDRRVVVDLGGCPMIDSTTLALLVGAHRRLRQQGGGLLIANANELVRTTLRVTQVDEYLAVTEPADP